MVNPAEITVAIETEAPELRRAAVELAALLGAAVVDRKGPASHRDQVTGSPADHVLAMRDAGLELRDSATRPGKGLRVDFTGIDPRRAAHHGGFSRRQPLARAMGAKSKIVLDATAGLGHDAALLACMGFRVVAAERSPIVAALLRDGLRRAIQDEHMRAAIGDRLTILNADARAVLAAQEHQFDVVYIDPMFPPKRKASALARKSIRMVRAVVGDDEDAADLLAFARRCCKRVVVKRPTYAQPLADRPVASIAGKLVRYDLYTVNPPGT